MLIVSRQHLVLAACIVENLGLQSHVVGHFAEIISISNLLDPLLLVHSLGPPQSGPHEGVHGPPLISVRFCHGAGGLRHLAAIVSR